MIDLLISGLSGFMLLDQRISLLNGMMNEALSASVAHIGEAVKEKAKEQIGSYPSGSYGSWPELAESTQERRERAGYPPNEPLLMDGIERESIISVGPFHKGGGIEMSYFVVGFDAESEAGEYAAVHELGNPENNEPARPLLIPAAMEVAESQETEGILVGVVGGYVGRVMGRGWEYAPRDGEE